MPGRGCWCKVERLHVQADVMVQTCNFSRWEVEARRSGVHDLSWLCRELGASLACTRDCFKAKQNKLIGAGETSQQLKDLPQGREDQNLEPWNPCKHHVGMVAHLRLQPLKLEMGSKSKQMKGISCMG